MYVCICKYVYLFYMSIYPFMYICLSICTYINLCIYLSIYLYNP